MELIGKPTINPLLFYSGKISGYLTWIILLLLFVDIDIIHCKSMLCNRHIAILILLAGLLFSILSIINLGKSVRLGLPTNDTFLKTNGIYKISRNPMYLGFNLLTLSSMVYSLNTAIILLGVYSMFVYHLIIIGEERFLKEKFGVDFQNYMLKVRRYL
ncbi:MAG: hypothetical protein JW798_06480 [Prolixibacteraceae bacterium]|nr:hypothetical protein [Prolixibacteraceae bacterium]